MENKNLTIMFTDMKGFTSRTSGQSRSATMDMLRSHKELLLPVIQKRGGRLIKSIGDAFLVTFDSPTDAVLTGIELQQTLRTHNAQLDEKNRIEIRVAVNTGEVMLDEGDVYGEAVNIAARIEGIAEANEIYFTESTYLSMNKSEVPSAEIGYRVLKGIPNKIKVYRVMREGEQAPATREVVYDTAGAAMVQPAVMWRRIAAMAIDVGLVILAVIILSMGARKQITRDAAALRDAARQNGFAAPNDAPDGHPLRARADGIQRRKDAMDKKTKAAWNVIFILYMAISTGLKGKTVGKHLMKIRVVRTDGGPAGFARAVPRTLLYYLSAAPVFLGFLWAFFDPARRAWHDKISDTAVTVQA